MKCIAYRPRLCSMEDVEAREMAMKKAVVFATMAAFATSAGAQVSTIEAANAPKKVGDPDRIVCEREETTGSRLGARRVCLTVAQWEDKRREHREHTEKVQRIQNQSPSN